MSAELASLRIIGVLGLCLVLFTACDDLSPPAKVSDSLSSLRQAKGFAGLLHLSPSNKFQHAVAGKPLVFPKDHGPHPKFRTGWWYFTGNLETPNGRDFGYQLTFFRRALKAGRAARPSAWGSRQVYMAHFAITDIRAEKFYRRQRLSRAGLKLAGASSQPFQVWLEDWQVKSVRPDSFLPLQLAAQAHTEQGDFALRLLLQPGKAMVLQGEQGFSAKSREPGNASYYYSFTRMPSRGVVVTPAGQFQVTGQSWFDREWSTSALSREQTGWDWFALHLADGRDLMLYRLRLRNGTVDPVSTGVMVESDGSQQRISAQNFQLQPVRYWQDSTGRSYPVAWKLRYQDLRLDIDARIDGQAYTQGIPYWEGAVAVSGNDSSGVVSGLGYLEMSGY